ncbi:MAG: RluA family pseudouridine synthase [Desulfobulbus sp.]|jgi:23S rRNA pseudouridine1911/1915/1917 synthase
MERNGEGPAVREAIPATPRQTFAIGPVDAGRRLDQCLTAYYPEHSRSFLNKLIVSGLILVDGRTVKAGHRLRAGECVGVSFPEPVPAEILPQQIDFSVLFEDAALLVINKPPNLVVHPACGHASGTLVNGLMHLCQDLPAAEAGRPGIVHRLDKDTSGIMLVAKTEQALRLLMADFKNRRVRKTYHAILLRSPVERTGRVVAPIGRHPVDRKKMAVRHDRGRHAATCWHVLETFANGWCLAEIGLETGRTHQIRVHMASLGAPVAGDGLYGGGIRHDLSPRPARQMLHASELRFRHPLSGQDCVFAAPLWEDMRALIDALRQPAP